MRKFTHSFTKLTVICLLMVVGNAGFSQEQTEVSNFETISSANALQNQLGDHFLLRSDIHRIHHFNAVQDHDSKNPDWAFLPTSVELLSVSQNPRQYNYVYTPNAKRFTTSVKNFQNGNWVNDLFELCSYDANGNLLSSLWKSWDGFSFVNASRTTWSYTDNGKVQTETKQQWTAGAWVNAEKTTNTYDINGNLVASLNELWVNGAWENNFYDLLTYNTTNLLTGLTRQIYNGNGWDNALQLIYDYNANGLLSSGIIQEWDTTSWLNTYKETYTYNSTSKVILYIGQDWIGSSWKNSEKYTYTYNTLGYVILSIGEKYVNNAWVNFTRDQYNYNDFGGIQAQVSEAWIAGAWLNQRLVNNAFDDNGNALTCDLFHWNGSDWIQNQDGQIFMPYSYSMFNNIYTGYRTNAVYASFLVGSIEQPLSAQALSFGPNPANDDVKLFFSLDKSAHVSVALYNLAGSQVMKKDFGQMPTGDHQVELNVQTMSSGIYLLQWISGENKQTEKIILKN